MSRLMEFLITSSTLIMFVIIIRACFMGKVKNGLIYALWLVVLVKLICPVNLFESPLSIMNGVEQLQNTVDENVERNSISENKQKFNVISAIPKTENYAVENTEKISEVHVAGNVDDSVSIQNSVKSKEKQDSQINTNTNIVENNIPNENTKSFQLEPVQIVIIIWSIGMVLCLLVVVTLNIRFCKSLSKNRKLLDQYDGKCKVYKINKVSTPCLYGVFKPAVYIPEVIINNLTDRDIEQILEHENKHYSHKDHIWSFIRCIMVCVYWFHPLVWAAAKLSKKDAELFCDESILAGKSYELRIQYGEMLLNVARVSNNISMLYPITAVHSGKREMKKRISFIGKNKKHYKVVSVLLCLILLASSLVTFTACKEIKQSEQMEKYIVTDMKTKINGFDVTIPQVDKMNSEAKAFVNETIKKHIEDKLNDLSSKASIFYFDYSVENQSEEILSVLIQYEYMGKNAAHPSASAFAININIKEQSEITKDEMISYRQLEYAVENDYLKKVVKNSHGIEGEAFLNDENILKSYSDIDENQFYISGDYIGLIFELIHAQGDYEIFEIKDMNKGDFGVIQYTNIWINSEHTYKGSFLATSSTTAEMGSEKTNMEMMFEKIEVEEQVSGAVYELLIYGNEGRTLGYLYITEDKIYKFSDLEKGIDALENNQLPEDAYVVCQKEEMKDSLGEDEKGWHQYIEVKDDTIEYHSYNNMVETGYYETIIWKKNVGITFYHSGYGAERDSIKLEIEDNNSLNDKYSTIMESYTDEEIYQIIEEDFDDCGEKEAFVLMTYEYEGESGNSNGCELWYVKGESVDRIIRDEKCTGGNIQMLLVEGEKHIIFNAENARLGSGNLTAIYSVKDGKVKELFSQKGLNLYATENGLTGYEWDYYVYEKDIDDWTGYATMEYQFYWSYTEREYKEYTAEEITEEEFLELSNAKEVLEKAINYYSDIYTDDEMPKVEKKYLKRENNTIDINLIFNYKNEERYKFCATVSIDGNSVLLDNMNLSEGNKKLSLLEKLKEYESSIQ